MCGGGGIGKAFKKGFKILDAATFGGASLATAGLGLSGNDPLGDPLGFGATVDSVLDPPKMPSITDSGSTGVDPVTGLIPTQQDAAVMADSEQLAAKKRERRRAAARFGRASTIGAGSVGAPVAAGKVAVGS